MTTVRAIVGRSPFRSGRTTVSLLCLLFAVAPIQSVLAQSADTGAGDDDTADVGKIGKLHDDIRRADKRESGYERATDVYTDYTTWKDKFQDSSNISYSMDVSLLQQWGLSGGGSPALQITASPSVDWTLFKSKEWGTGSVQLAYTFVPSYPTRQNGADITSNLGLATGVNDNGAKFRSFSQLTYTQAGPKNKWLFTAGQYPLYNFDGNSYLANQQQNFNNEIFAQNGSSTYNPTGWGGYVQFNVSKTVQLASGFQATNNTSGLTLTTRGVGDDCCTAFAYAQWTPSVRGMGSSQYSLSYFDTPSHDGQAASKNWSLNAVQNLDDTWAVFGRANHASGAVGSIKASYAVGAAMNNPLKRAATDQIALAVGYSDLAAYPTNPVGARNEKIVEGYWTWTVAGGLLLTPSVQMTFDPAFNASKRHATTLSVRATVMF